MSKILLYHGSIPMKPYLRQFVLSIENRVEAEEIDLTANTFVAKLLNLFMTGKTSLRNRNDMKGLGQPYTEALRFTLPYKSLNQGRILVTPQNVVAFNKLVYDLFHETLLNRILFAREWGLEEIKVIEKFLQEHGIEPEEDIELASVKKASYRLRKTKKLDHFYTPDNREAKRSAFARA